MFHDQCRINQPSCTIGWLNMNIFEGKMSEITNWDKKTASNGRNHSRCRRQRIEIDISDEHGELIIITHRGDEQS